MSQKMRVVLDTNILINALEAELEGPRANRRQFVAHAVTGHVLITDEMMGIKLAPDFRFQLHQPIPPALQQRFTTLSQPPVKKDAYGRTKKAPPAGLHAWKSRLK